VLPDASSILATSTISRNERPRSGPFFFSVLLCKDLTHDLLMQSVDAARMGLVSLCAESVDHLRGLVRSFHDGTSLKAITLILTKAGPVLGLANAELRRPPAKEGRLP